MLHHYHYDLLNLAHPPARILPDTLGVEITDKRFSGYCGLGNIDPQHGDDFTPTSPAAIEVCLDHPLPEKGCRLLTIRPDLDALGGMAVLNLRSTGEVLTPALAARVEQIAAADRFSVGPWPGRRALPASINDIAEFASDKELVALSLCANDRQRSLQERVEVLSAWLMHGLVPSQYLARVNNSAESLLRSIQKGATVFDLHFDGAIASVVSLEPAALKQAYRLAPVVVALNPAFPFSSGRRGAKFTIARWRDGAADLAAAVRKITRYEPDWGGQPGIKGSPQDRPSILTLEKVLDCVASGLPKTKNTYESGLSISERPEYSH